MSRIQRRRPKYNIYNTPTEKASMSHLSLLLLSVCLFVYGFFNIYHSTKQQHSSLIHQYEAMQKNWTLAQQQLRDSTFSLEVNYHNSIFSPDNLLPLSLNTDPNSDRFSSIINLEPSVQVKYVPYNYALTTTEQSIPPVDLNDGDDHEFPVAGFKIHATFNGGGGDEDAEPITSIIPIKLAPVPLAKVDIKHALTPSPETKCSNQQKGVYRNGKCEIFSRLKIICLQVELDAVGEGWELNLVDPADPLSYGCASRNEWNPLSYGFITPVMKTSMNSAELHFPVIDWNDIEVHVRASGDPFLKMEILTKGDSFDLGVDETEEWWIGVLFCVFGLLLFVSPYYAFKKACCGEGEDQREQRETLCYDAVAVNADENSYDFDEVELVEHGGGKRKLSKP